MPVFAAGLLLGLSIAAPVGPMALLCIGRTLNAGLAVGLATGAGIATGDAAYGTVAAFGLGAVTRFLADHAMALRILGGGFLVWLGVQAWRTAGAARTARKAGGAGGLGPAYALAVGLTLTNPATMLSFLAAFAALGLADRTAGAWVMVAGVFLGSAGWWLIMCSAVSFGRRALTQTAMARIDRMSAVVLIAFGLAAAAGLL